MKPHRDHHNVRLVGGLFTPDFLGRLSQADPKLDGIKPADYHKKDRADLRESISAAWAKARAHWLRYRQELAERTADDPALGLTWDRFLLPLFEELGYGRLSKGEKLTIGDREYRTSHVWQATPIHLLGWNVPLDTRSKGVSGASKRSPHGMLQDFLNRSDEHLWGIVSNGRLLRLLRDNLSLTRQAYVEFDLEAIFEQESFSDFSLLYLFCHQSRVEHLIPEDCWLEKWSKVSHESGARALDKLREGVRTAIEILGRAFLQHKNNQDLRAALHEGRISAQDYYRILMRLVYRTLFLCIAEDRGLLLLPKPEGDDPDPYAQARTLYLRAYSTQRLRGMARRLRGGPQPDLYETFKVVMRCLDAEDPTREALALPALGSLLWKEETIGPLAHASLDNHAFLQAIRGLAFVEEGKTRIPVDYANLGSEEFGAIYESLLELHPELDAQGYRFQLKEFAGSERKTTGSYYTPESLVQLLLKSTVDPILEERSAQARRAKTDEERDDCFLSLKVVDPACGSGHFLIAAAHRIAAALASVRTGDEEPSPSARRDAMREVVMHCLHGVDMNPMAVELCKVNLWLESLQAGKPLAFLDSKIRLGNALLGTTPALLEQGIPDAAFTGMAGDDREYLRHLRTQNRKTSVVQFQSESLTQDVMFTEQVAEGFLSGWSKKLGKETQALESVSQDDVHSLRDLETKWHKLQDSPEHQHRIQLANAWCASFVSEKRRDNPACITNAEFSKLTHDPASLSTTARKSIEALADQYAFFHWHLAFPRVFTEPEGSSPASNPKQGWSGGFDIVLGNPPWERIKLQEKEWFAARAPQVLGTLDDNGLVKTAYNTANRRKEIAKLAESENLHDRKIHSTFQQDLRTAEGASHLIRDTMHFPLCGRGDVNTYSIFAELKRQLLAPTGRAGLIVPTGIATDDTTKFFFQDLMDKRSLVALWDFENRKKIFPAIDSRIKFCLLTLSGLAAPQSQGADFVFFALAPADLDDEDRHFTLTAEDIALLNPNTRTCPIFRSKRDAEICKKIYRKVPVLWKKPEDGPEENPWGLKFMAMFHMSNDSLHFRTRAELEADGFKLTGNRFHKQQAGQTITWLPLYEAKMIHHYNHRFGDYRDLPEGSKSTQLPDVPESRLQDPDYQVLPRYWVPAPEVESRLRKTDKDGNLLWHWPHPWLLGWRDITNSTNERTVIASLLPRVGVGNKIPLLLIANELHDLGPALAANLSSFALDYAARQKIGGTTLNYFLLNQFPVLPPNAYSRSCPWKPEISLKDWIRPRSLALINTAHELGLSDEYPLQVFDEHARAKPRAELDAAYFHLYGLGRDKVAHVMDTFPIVRRNDCKRFGDYRTKTLILEAYDRLQRSIDASPSLAEPT